MGNIFIITAPSGTGKTTIINRIKKDIGTIGYCISHTTRKPRKGEVHGVHYYFIDEKKFQKMIENREFLEWAVVYGKYYGTSFTSMERALSSGEDLLMDLDIRGARAAKERYPDSLLVFIFPPSMHALEERLKKRAKNDIRDIQLRIDRAMEEIQESINYDYIIINDHLNKAVDEMEAIIISKKASKERRLPLVKELFHL